MEYLGFPNYDICFNVLSRLPTKDLLRLKCVRKSWCQLISDPIFRRVHSRRKEPISGFFLQQKIVGSDDIGTFAYISIELLGAGFGQSVFNFLPEDVKVLASCSGLICYQRSSSSQDPSLYVCNLLTRELVGLNPTQPVITDSIALAFDPCQDTRGSSTNFKLVSGQRIQTGSDEPYDSFNIYSSDTGSSRISQATCHCGGDLSSRHVIFIGETLHWATNSGEIVAFDVKEEKCSLISVPEPDSDEMDEIMYASCIGESNGQLHYLLVSDYGIRIWSLEDYHKSEWNLKHSRSVAVIVNKNPRLLHEQHYMWPMHPLAFQDGYLLLDCTNIYLYNVKTTKMVKVLSHSQLQNRLLPFVHPYSMSLVPLNSALGLHMSSET